MCLIVGLILNRGHEGDHGCVRWKLERRKVAKLESKIKLHQGTWNYAHDFVFNIQKFQSALKRDIFSEKCTMLAMRMLRCAQISIDFMAHIEVKHIILSYTVSESLNHYPLLLSRVV